MSSQRRSSNSLSESLVDEDTFDLSSPRITNLQRGRSTISPNRRSDMAASTLSRRSTLGVTNGPSSPGRNTLSPRFTSWTARESTFNIETGSVEDEELYIEKKDAVCCSCWLWYMDTVFYRICKQYWFIIGIAIVVGIAKAYPYLGQKDGLIYAQYSLKIPAIVIIFLIQGMNLKTKALVDGLKQWKVHVFSQCVSLGIMPLIGWPIGRLIDHFDQQLGAGFIIVMALPTTVASNVVFTQKSGGNEVISIINSVIGNCVGIFITPLWCKALLSGEPIPPLGSFLLKICYEVILPCILGQLLQNYASSVVDFLKKYLNFSDMTQYCLLTLIYCSFCNTFDQTGITLNVVAFILVIIFAFCIFAGSFMTGLSSHYWTCCGGIGPFPLVKEDAVALAFTMGSKTAGLGLPIISLLFADVPGYGIYTIPLIVYYVIQVICQASAVPSMQEFINPLEEDEANVVTSI